MSKNKIKIPEYRLLANELISDILSGKYPVDSVLPGENQLAALRGLSRHTVRESMKLLEQRGLIVRKRRAGSTVVTNEPPDRYNQKVQSVNDLLQYGSASRLQIIHSEEFLIEETVAKSIKQQAGKYCIKMDGIRYQLHDNRPFGYSQIYFPVSSKAKRKQLCDLSQAIRYVTQKLDISRLKMVEQTLTAENASEEIALRLQVKPGTATMKSVRSFYDTRCTLIATAYTWHAGDLFSYSTELTKI